MAANRCTCCGVHTLRVIARTKRNRWPVRACPRCDDLPAKPKAQKQAA